MNHYVISDTHFNHLKIIKHSHRPENFEVRIIDGAKDLKENDVLINLGDFCWKIRKDNPNLEKWKELKCKKILVLGNHDNASLNFYYEYFDFVCNSFQLIRYGEKFIFTHKPISIKNGINIHGHFHNIPCDRWEPELTKVLTPNHYLYILENNYKPINIEKYKKSLSRTLDIFNREKNGNIT